MHWPTNWLTGHPPRTLGPSTVVAIKIQTVQKCDWTWNNRQRIHCSFPQVCRAACFDAYLRLPLIVAGIHFFNVDISVFHWTADYTVPLTDDSLPFGRALVKETTKKMMMPWETCSSSMHSIRAACIRCFSWIRVVKLFCRTLPCSTATTTRINNKYIVPFGSLKANESQWLPCSAHLTPISHRPISDPSRACGPHLTALTWVHINHVGLSPIRPPITLASLRGVHRPTCVVCMWHVVRDVDVTPMISFVVLGGHIE